MRESDWSEATGALKFIFTFFPHRRRDKDAIKTRYYEEKKKKEC
jgi:hypothetical protein